MELRVIQPTFPEVIEFNFSELKEEITKKASEYMNLVYTDNQIGEAKKDLATLRKFTKALSDERIKIKKECLKPYEDFEAKIKELDGIVNGAIQNIDGQVKGYEEQEKVKKQTAIESYFEGRNPFNWLNLKQIFNEKWLNASVKMPKVTSEIDTAIEQIEKDLATLSNLPEFSFEATEEYKHSLDINKAITEGHRLSEIQKRKAEAKKVVDAIPTEPIVPQPTSKVWLSFRAHLTVDEAILLKKFFDNRNIEFEAL